jgi:hypothetical protein
VRTNCVNDCYDELFVEWLGPAGAKRAVVAAKKVDQVGAQKQILDLEFVARRARTTSRSRTARAATTPAITGPSASPSRAPASTPASTAPAGASRARVWHASPSRLAARGVDPEGGTAPLRPRRSSCLSPALAAPRLSSALGSRAKI